MYKHRRADATRSPATVVMAEQVARFRTTTGEPAAQTATRLRIRPRAWLRRFTPEHLLVLVLSLGVLVVHDVGYMLSQPFWNDEAWVAVTTRFPLSQLPETTSSTPIGWSFLVRIFTIGASESSRIVPLAFAGLAVAAAYWLARGLGWRGRTEQVAAGVLAGLAVLLAPAMLLRDDLKQYTADAFMALLILVLTSRLERSWSRRGLAALSVAVWGGMLISDVAAFTGVAAIGALFVVQLARRAWGRLAEVAVAGGVTAVLMLGVYEAFDARAADALGASTYWDGYYVPLGHGLHASWTFITKMLGHLRVDFGLGPAWLALPLVIVGLVTIFRLGRPATALAVLVLLPEMIVVSAVKVYPFGDLRTSTWLIAVTVAVAAIGVGGICALARQWLRDGATAWAVALMIAAAAVAGFSAAAAPYVRGHTIPNEDVRDQADYVAKHAAADDVILVNLNSNWGFAYYWPYGQPARRLTDVVRQGYEAYFPDQPRIVVAPNRDLAGVTVALQEALSRVRPGSCARIWLIRSHVIPAEAAAWKIALAAAHLTPVVVGNHGLTVLQPGGRACG
jgi:hypothetical protein